MTELRAAAEAVRPYLEQVTFLADRAVRPESWAALERARRLYACRLAELAERSGPPLVAVIGGTNVGKSTVFNLALGAGVALPCGTAAGTKAVALSVPAGWRDRFEDALFLPWFVKHAWSEPAPLNEALGTAPRLYLHLRQDGPAVALADTPDIDSTRLANHQVTDDVFYAADAVLFVTSEQKYADAACDEYLAAARRYGKATVIAFNRAQPESEALRDLVEVKLEALSLSAQTPLIRLPVLTAPALRPETAAGDEVIALRRTLTDLADRGPELRQAARLGAARGFAVDFTAVLDDLSREVDQTAGFLRRAEALAERLAARFEPTREPDDLDQAVLEALEALRVPGIDYVYEQLGLVRRRLMSGLRFLGGWMGQGLGQRPRTIEEAAQEAAERERQEALVTLENLLAGLRDELRSCPPELRLALLDRLPSLGDGGAREAAVGDYVVRLEARRRDIVADARERILTELRRQEVKIKLSKGVARTASVAASLAIMLHTGGMAPHDFAVAPLADVATKWVLERSLGRSWRERLEAEVQGRRRELVVEWLRDGVLGPLAASLPESHRPGFLPAAREAVERLRRAGEGGANGSERS